MLSNKAIEALFTCNRRVFLRPGALLAVLPLSSWAQQHLAAEPEGGLGPAAPAAELLATEAFNAVQQHRLTLIDIRRPDEWAATGVARGALKIDMQHPQGPAGFAQAVLRAVNGNKDAPIALICRTGNRTTHVQRYLQTNGFSRTYQVREGMAGSTAGPGWIKRGLPLDPG
jgi:rhodanese-related sulfurtransferase